MTEARVRLFTPLFVLVCAVQTAAAQSPWVTPDSAAKTVTLELAVTPKGDATSARIAGFREGGAQVVVPLGWTVRWNWHSDDPGAQHSLVVMQEREKLPTEGGRPVFTNAMTKSLSDGLAAGQSDHTTFEAEQAGWYWILCGVPSHALQGEWLGLKVDADAKTAGVVVK
jgi:plastocyanin